MSYGNLVYGGVQTPSMTEMGAFMANGAVHRAVHTPGLHGDMGSLVYGADEGGTEVSMIDQVMAHLKEYWMWYTGGAIALAAAVYYMQKPRTLANRRKRRRKGQGRKGKRSAAQIRAAKRNLAKARRAAAGRKARKSKGGKRKVTAQQAAVTRYMRAGYSMKQAWSMVKAGARPKSPKSRKSRKSRSRSRR